jgi:hypothetical protein
MFVVLNTKIKEKAARATEKTRKIKQKSEVEDPPTCV